MAGSVGVLSFGLNHALVPSLSPAIADGVCTTVGTGNMKSQLPLRQLALIH